MQAKKKRTAAAALVHAAAAAALAFGAAAASHAAAAPAKATPPAATAAMTLSFGGVGYVHRWSKAGTNEFTPATDANLDAWHDMVTVRTYDQVTDAGLLEYLANRTLTTWQQDGKVIRRNSTEAAAGHPAEHFIAAVLVAPSVFEVTFARFVMAGDVGEAILYAHRIYASPGAPEAQRLEMAKAANGWLAANGERTEKTLMAWDGAPTLGALRTLPQSAGDQ